MNGALAQVPGFNHVLTTAFDSVTYNSTGTRINNIYTGGVQRYNNSAGLMTGAYDSFLRSDSNTFGKSNGIGDIEALCDKAPVEIGNRVWSDSNGDGIQTPSSVEIGIAGVTVRLYGASGNLIATAVTDANGEYYFSSASGTSTTSAIYGLNLLPNTNYLIRIDNPANFNSGGPLAGLTLTSSNVSSQDGFTDGSDSDAVNVTNPTGSPSSGVFPVISMTTGSSGQNNHNYDFGFRSGVTASNVSVGGRALDNWWNGISGAQVTLITQNGASKTMLTDENGYFMFDEVEGQSAIVMVSAKGRTFTPENQFVSLTETPTNFTFSPEGVRERQR